MSSDQAEELIDALESFIYRVIEQHEHPNDASRVNNYNLARESLMDELQKVPVIQ